MKNTLAIKLGLPELPGKVETVGDAWKVFDALKITRPSIIGDKLFEDANILLTLETQRREGIEDRIKDCLDYARIIRIGLYDNEHMSESFLSIERRHKRDKAYLESTLNLKWVDIKKAYEGGE